MNVSRKNLAGTRSGPSEQIFRDLITEVSHNNCSLTLRRFAAESEPGIFSSGEVPGFVFVAAVWPKNYGSGLNHIRDINYPLYAGFQDFCPPEALIPSPWLLLS